MDNMTPKKMHLHKMSYFEHEKTPSTIENIQFLRKVGKITTASSTKRMARTILTKVTKFV